MKKMTYNLCVIIGAIMMSTAAHARDFQLDRGIGFDKKGRGEESWVDTKESAESSALGNRFGQSNNGISATAIGNLISVQAAQGSHTVINAMQINTGNQTAEVSLRGAKQYKNVELPNYRPQGYVTSYTR